MRELRANATKYDALREAFDGSECEEGEGYANERDCFHLSFSFST